MTTHPLANTLRRLASGHLVEIDEYGKASPVSCSWLVQVVSGNPEPDSIEDTYKIVECGARVFALTFDPEGGWGCESGHHHWPYGSDQQQAEERIEFMAERHEAGVH